jgi:hypothetical protein
VYVRIGNCSGFYGDRVGAMREMLTGGELDYLTGDYLAELTMLILGRDKMKNPERGYAKTFLIQLRTASAWRTTAACGSSPTPAGSTRPDWPTPCGAGRPSRHPGEGGPRRG